MGEVIVLRLRVLECVKGIYGRHRTRLAYSLATVYENQLPAL
jgi:hypothetical protein